MRRFYKPSLWIPQHFLLTNPNLHHGLLTKTEALGVEFRRVHYTLQQIEIDPKPLQHLTVSKRHVGPTYVASHATPCRSSPASHCALSTTGRMTPSTHVSSSPAGISRKSHHSSLCSAVCPGSKF